MKKGKIKTYVKLTVGVEEMSGVGIEEIKTFLRAHPRLCAASAFRLLALNDLHKSHL
jgi:hypothetical protein